MKNIAVICNNRVEWRHFVETLQFVLSKENNPYKAAAESVVDLKNQVKYIYVNNHQSSIKRLRGIELCGITNVAGFIDLDLNEVLISLIREEK